MTGADGKLNATEVSVFPEAARGTGEGYYAWDLGPNSTMTNANADIVVEGTSGRGRKLSYKGGSKTATVPANVPVVTFAPATRSDLTPGRRCSWWRLRRSRARLWHNAWWSRKMGLYRRFNGLGRGDESAGRIKSVNRQSDSVWIVVVRTEARCGAIRRMGTRGHVLCPPVSHHSAHTAWTSAAPRPSSPGAARARTWRRRNRMGGAHRRHKRDCAGARLAVGVDCAAGEE